MKSHGNEGLWSIKFRFDKDLPVNYTSQRKWVLVAGVEK